VCVCVCVCVCVKSITKCVFMKRVANVCTLQKAEDLLEMSISSHIPAPRWLCRNVYCQLSVVCSLRVDERTNKGPTKVRPAVVLKMVDMLITK